MDEEETVATASASGVTRAFLVSTLRTIHAFPRVNPIKFFRPKAQKPIFDFQHPVQGVSRLVISGAVSCTFLITNAIASMALFNAHRVVHNALDDCFGEIRERVQQMQACMSSGATELNPRESDSLLNLNGSLKWLSLTGLRFGEAAIFVFPHFLGGIFGGLFHGAITTPFRPLAWSAIVTPTSVRRTQLFSENDSNGSKHLGRSSDKYGFTWRGICSSPRFNFVLHVAKVFAVADACGFALFFSTHEAARLYLTTKLSHDSPKGSARNSSQHGDDGLSQHFKREDGGDVTAPWQHGCADEIEPMVRVHVSSSTWPAVENRGVGGRESLSRASEPLSPSSAAALQLPFHASLRRRSTDGAWVVVVGSSDSSSRRRETTPPPPPPPRGAGPSARFTVPSDNTTTGVEFEIHLPSLGVSVLSGAAAGLAFHACAYPWTAALEEACASPQPPPSDLFSKTTANEMKKLPPPLARATEPAAQFSRSQVPPPPTFQSLLSASRRLGISGCLFRGSGLKACASQVCVGALTFAVYDTFFAASSALRSALEEQQDR